MKCSDCGKPRGKRNPKKDGWQVFVWQGVEYFFCPGCIAHFDSKMRRLLRGSEE